MDGLRYQAGRARRRWSALVHGQSYDAFDARALQTLAPLARGYVPWSGYAMRPSGVVAVLNEIVTGDVESVVEAGSGISTIYTGRLLAQRGRGRLTSIEHDAEWAAHVRGWIEGEGLSERVTVVHAPLVDEGWDTGPWYDTDVLGAALEGVRPQLLVVDGPPAHRADTRLARYPAGPYFRDAGTIVLDDVGRRGEQEVVRRWEAELGRRFVLKYLDGGIAISRRD